jgi:hypothetical protein
MVVRSDGGFEQADEDVVAAEGVAEDDIADFGGEAEQKG